MSPSPNPRPRRRRAGLAIAGLTLVAVLLPTVGTSPAGAATAPLTTEDGIAIRVDENALNGPALDAIENALQPFVDDMIRDGATGPGAPFSNHKALYVSSDVELSLDFLTPGGSRPDGGLNVHADIEDVEIRFVMDPVWPFSDCNIWARPDDGSIDATGRVDRDELPAAPLTVEPISATWDDSPTVTSDGVCWSYVAWQAITNWWDGIWDSSDPESTAARIERELNDVAQDLIDGLWDDHVVPVVDSLEAFGITFGQLRTDTHGLIVTADLDASGGLSIPGLGGPFPVGDTEDSGATSNVNTLLAARSEVTVSVHPNVVNQFATAMNDGLNNNFVSVPLPGAAVEEFLVPPANRGSFSDTGWRMFVTVAEPYYTTPSGPGGRPQFRMDQATFGFYNTSYIAGAVPVATFSGSAEAIGLVTEVRSGTDNWGPSVIGDDVDVAANLVSAIPPVTTWAPDGDDIDPFMALGVDAFNDELLVPFVSLAPIEIGGLSIDLCTSCTRVSGDQRYTEFLTVG